MRIVLAIALAAGSLILTVQGNAPKKLLALTADSIDQVKKLYRLGWQHDDKTILRVKPHCVKSQPHDVCNAFPLALYIAKPSRYREYFVDKFPTDSVGVMGDYYSTFTIHLGGPLLLPFESLADIANNGNREAASKLVVVSTVADGVVAEMLDDHVYGMALHWPTEFYDAVGHLTDIQITRVVCQSAHSPEMVALARRSLPTANAQTRPTLERMLALSRRC